MMKHLFSIIFPFFCFIFVIGCTTQKSTTYSRIPKPIIKCVEKNFEYSNAFFYKVFDKSNTFLLWYYKESTVFWFSYINGKISNKGAFDSNIGSDNLSVYEINDLLKKELDKFFDNYPIVLDGATFGYVLNVSYGQGIEIIGLTSIGLMSGYSNSTNNFIENDMNKIINLNYRVTSTP